MVSPARARRERCGSGDDVQAAAFAIPAKEQGLRLAARAGDPADAAAGARRRRP